MSTIKRRLPRAACARRAARARPDRRIGVRRRRSPSAAPRRPAARGGMHRGSCGAAPWRAASAAAFSALRFTTAKSSPACASDTAARSVIGDTPTSAMRPGVRAMRSRSCCTAISASETRPSASFVSPRTRAGDAQRLLEHQAQARPAEAELEAALLAEAHLADDLRLADAGRVEARPSSGTSARPRLRLATRASAARPRRSPPRGPSAAGTRRAASLGPACARCARKSARRDCRSRDTRARASCMRRAKSLQLRRGALLAAARIRRALRCRLGARTRRLRPKCSSNACTPRTGPLEPMIGRQPAPELAGFCHGTVTARPGRRGDRGRFGEQRDAALASQANARAVSVLERGQLGANALGQQQLAARARLIVRARALVAARGPSRSSSRAARRRKNAPRAPR